MSTGLKGLASALLLSAALGCTETIRATGSRDERLAARDGRIPAAAFFRHPLLSRVSLSPSGEQIAALYSKDGAQTVMVRRALGGEVRPVWNLEYPGWTIQSLGWAAEDHLLAGVNIPHPNATGVRARGSRLMGIPLDGSKWKYLGENWRLQQFTVAQDNIVDWLPDDPEHVLLSLWEPGNNGAGVYKLNVNSGALAFAVQRKTGVSRWHADHRHVVRAGSGRVERQQRYVLYARASESDSFEKIIEFNPFEEDGFTFAGFSSDPNVLYVYSEAATGRNAVHTYDLRTRSLGPAIASHPQFDIEGLRISSLDGRLLAALYHGERPEQILFDEAARLEQARIDAALPNTVNRIADESQDERWALVWSASDVQPPRYYLFDREEARLRFLFDAYPEIDRAALVPMRSVWFEARDGLAIHGYLTLPRSQARPLPAIIYPHGGPSARDIWGYDPAVQFLASRGFAVLQVNFRGSSGYGKRHRELGYREWGLAMQDDISDATRWLIEQGIADRERIGIYGGSYGGYASMMALVKTPELFRAGATFAGVSDLPMLIDDDGWYDFEEVNKPILGGDWGDRARLRQLSPTYNADKIRAPVLIAHGTEDWRVHVRQARALADALRDAGGDAELHVYDKEVHGFLDERNEIDFYEKLAGFFELHLGPEAGPSVSSETSR
jgi:dipeptidyl aminopeptidase/acylaminoacyl peptidase